ncbi:MAG: AAA family ATPase, partial [Verrucomicrobia bacterium]|nr:AAA family ATPase [Verrucomicrobiota bacterium]
MTDLSKYAFETLRDDGQVVLLRGKCKGNHGTILAMAPVSDQPPPGIIAQFEHAYSLRDEFDDLFVARPRELVSHSGQRKLLLDDPGGELLANFLGRPMGVSQFLKLAIGIAGALAQFHARGFIHKNIKPANILVDTEAGIAWLTGICLSSRLPRQRQDPEPPETIAGSLAYMAPEQTGRVNRSIDSRSDLYAFGVTLYELLTGTLPFTATDPMEWVHCHIARQPAAPTTRVGDIPGQLSAIVMKLLAKSPEERYQTAAGLKADFQRCLVAWETHGQVESFPLGEHDIPDRLLIPEKLYGREAEVGRLLAAFDRIVSQGTTELVLVSGYSGIGKSSVVNELHKALVPHRGLFASGKFDQYKRGIPYATLAQAFQSLIRHILMKSEEEVLHWRSALIEALGLNAQLVANLVPELEIILGAQPKPPPLSPQEEKNRFHRTLRHFIKVFARPEHPLALFIDDLQWLDTATLELLEALLVDSDMRYLLVLGAYRSNEVDGTHPLTRTLDTIENAGVRVEQV